MNRQSQDSQQHNWGLLVVVVYDGMRDAWKTWIQVEKLEHSS